MPNTLDQTHPSIAARLVDRTIASRYVAGSAKKVEWTCSQHPDVTFAMPIRQMVKHNGCPYCSGHRVLAGFNDLATTHEALAREAVDQQVVTTLSAGSNTAIEWRCAEGHTWSAIIANRTGRGGRAATGCPQCAGRQITPHVNDLATTHPALAEELVDPSDAIGVAPRTSTVKLRWRCANEDCRHIYTATPANRTATRSRGCPVCANRTVVIGKNDLATTHPDLAQKLIDPDDARTVVFGTGRNLAWFCPEHPQTPFFARPKTRSMSGCPYCANKAVLPGFNDLATTYPDISTQLVDPDIATTVTAGSTTVVQWCCPVDPEHVWSTPVYARTRASLGVSSGCPACFGIRPSRREDHLAEVVQQLRPDVAITRSDHTVLDGREIDILLPDLKIGIEFNGMFWHSQENGVGRMQHRDKLLAAREKGYRLIVVWEDDWIARPTIVIRMLAQRLHATDRLADVLPQADIRINERRFARTLRADEANAAESRRFLEENHIQGYATCTKIFVLRDEHSRIRALLGLRSAQANARMHRADGVWEIQRYATLGSVPGGFTKLLAHAEKELKAAGDTLTRWVSFSADDISQGNMYITAGFTADKHIPPDYSYVGDITANQRRPKESFQRRRFRTDLTLRWDEAWTEAQAAQENGLRRIWDYGKTRWSKDVL